jgi:hypothetical protein
MLHGALLSSYVGCKEISRPMNHPITNAANRNAMIHVPWRTIAVLSSMVPF